MEPAIKNVDAYAQFYYETGDKGHPGHP